MDDQEQPQTETGAPLSMDTAAALMGKALNPGPDRSENGQFKGKDEPAVEGNDDAKVIDLKTGKPPEAPKTEAVAEDDEDPEFEIPAEKEGEQPVRRKLSALWEGFERAEKLAKEVEDLKVSATRVPAEYQTQLQETIKIRSDYMKGLEQVARVITPVEPPLDMLDPASERYHPERYYELRRKFDSDRKNLRELAAEHQQLKKQQDEEQATLAKARSAREQEALSKVWPEFVKDQAVVESVAKALIQDYGFTTEDLNGITDHRQLRVIKDAIELRALKAKQAEAVKVVRQKPKLVKGAARTATTDTKAATRSSAMAELQATGSMAAAAKALAGLI